MEVRDHFQVVLAEPLSVGLWVPLEDRVPGPMELRIHRLWGCREGAVRACEERYGRAASGTESFEGLCRGHCASSGRYPVEQVSPLCSFRSELAHARGTCFPCNVGRGYLEPELERGPPESSGRPSVQFGLVEEPRRSEIAEQTSPERVDVRGLAM